MDAQDMGFHGRAGSCGSRGILTPDTVEFDQRMKMSAESPSIPRLAPAVSVRQTLAYVTFGVVYYALAAYAASLPLQTRLPLLIWPAHGVALGVLLVAPVRRWPAYLGLVLIATLAVGLDLNATWQQIAATMAVNAAQPLFVAAGLLRLARPRGQVDTNPGGAPFLIGIGPAGGAQSVPDPGFTHLPP